MDTTTIAAARYSRGAIALHWTIAVLIVLNIAAAWVSEGMSKADRAMVMGNHKAIGLIILALSLAMLVWRLMHKPPPLVQTLKPWEAVLAKVVHFALYALMIGLPLTGWAMVSGFSKGKPVSIFGLFDVPALPVGVEKAVIENYAGLHTLFGFAMVGLVAVHVAGALKHQFIDRDGTLRRIVPGMR